ncbi:hypothetical protein OHS70_34215 [Streptomyces sp. NBC_00390]|uniref:hypothetical protein n=1 Tax=Streptomyces sp. NBC_00390 TaxID=2975736 RepID=UPI002E2187CC
MKITDTRPADVRHVRIATSGTAGSLTIGGVDYSRYVSGYTVHQLAGQPAQVVLQLSPARTSADFNGYARVAIGEPYEPGEAAARFLSAIDASLLEKAAMNRSDLSGQQYGYTAAVLAQLQQWARGEFEEPQEMTDGLTP